MNTVLARVASALLGLGAVALAVWACIDPQFRDRDGALGGLFCLPIAAAVACVVAASTIRSRLASAGGWVALAVVGQALALQTVDAGKSIHYQHYRPLDQAASPHGRIVLAGIALHAIAVVWGLVTHRRSVATIVSGRIASPRAVAFVAAIVLSSATLSRDPREYVVEVVFASFAQMLALVTILLAVLAVPDDMRATIEKRIDGVLDGDGPGRVDRFAIVGAIWVTAVAATLSAFVYQRHAHIPDEVVYLYHARYLAEGRLAMAPPPVPQAFNVDLMTYEDDRWYCPVPFGWPSVLALGVLAGVPWLVNPFLGGVTVLLASKVFESMFDRRAARLGVLLLCASPWFLFMNMNFMTHASSLACTLLAILGIVRAREGGAWAWAFAAGGAVGFVSLIRPLEGLILAVLLGVWALGLGARRLALSAIAAFAAGVVVIGGLVLPYNRFVTGDALTMPLNLYLAKYYVEGANSLGFGPNRGLSWPIDPFPGYTPLEGVINIALNVSTLNVELFGWATGSLLFLVAFALRPRSFTRGDAALAALGLAVVGVHFLYWFAGGPDFGPRYWYLCIVPCVALTARGALEADRAQGAGRATIAVLMLCALSVVNFIPWRAADKYYHYLNMRPDVRELSAAHDFGRSLVLVRGRRHPDYASAVVYNPLDFAADAPIYAWDTDPAATAAVLEAYRDRSVWVMNGPTVTGRGFEVVAGPIPASELLGRLSRYGGLGV
jgi:4-amino-4-deoxy-L-arabinose transferase-like glycosyltransferase